MDWVDAMVDFILIVPFHCDDYDMAAFTASYVRSRLQLVGSK